MGKIGLIIRQEYKNRVAKKSFLLLTFLMPLLFVLLLLVPMWLSLIESGKKYNVAVVDWSGCYSAVFLDTEKYLFDEATAPLDSFRTNSESSGYDAIVVISGDLRNADASVTIYSEQQVDLELKQYIQKALEKQVREDKLASFNIPDIESVMSILNTEVSVETVKWNSDGSETLSSSEIALVVGMLATMLIYMFIFVYGAQVMNSVVQEKVNRIVEVMVCSVKPFELMMGKIISIALVGLTQFAIWIVLTLVFFLIFGQPLSFQAEVTSTSDFSAVYSMLMSINWIEMLVCFVAYFIGGYLLYASIFAAIGSAVDNETDTQQFMLPITIPILFAMYAAIYSAQNPDGPLAFWCSMIPFTSPIVMMVRLPFGVLLWEKIVSLVILFASFVATTWLSAKIYRTGILMYGKKISWRELWKWLKA
ncbi:MAG TPA: ABC transporter permease [Bacteroidales bacterium]|jgi:ABC-2 type transport system permease protein|nr:ABC transporter permease [Bacteroidales bacterium]